MLSSALPLLAAQVGSASEGAACTGTWDGRAAAREDMGKGMAEGVRLKVGGGGASASCTATLWPGTLPHLYQVPETSTFFEENF